MDVLNNNAASFILRRKNPFFAAIIFKALKFTFLEYKECREALGDLRTDHWNTEWWEAKFPWLNIFMEVRDDMPDVSFLSDQAF